jgi:hypothetical protein
MKLRAGRHFDSHWRAVRSPKDQFSAIGARRDSCLWFAKNTSGAKALRNNAFITLLKSPELWYCDDLPTLKTWRGNGHCLPSPR